MLYPFGHKIKTKYQQYTSKGIICLYFLEVQYFKRIIQPYYTFWYKSTTAIYKKQIEV